MPRLLVLAVVVASLSTPSAAQTRPDFSGTWIVVTPGDSTGQHETIVQTPATLSFRHPSEAGHHDRTYNLDGTATKSVWQSHGRDVVTNARTAWEGATLVIYEVTQYPEGRTLDSRRTLTINASGQLEQTFTGKLNGEVVPEVKTVSRRK